MLQRRPRLPRLPSSSRTRRRTSDRRTREPKTRKTMARLRRPLHSPKRAAASPFPQRPPALPARLPLASPRARLRPNPLRLPPSRSMAHPLRLAAPTLTAKSQSRPRLRRLTRPACLALPSQPPSPPPRRRQLSPPAAAHPACSRSRSSTRSNSRLAARPVQALRHRRASQQQVRDRLSRVTATTRTTKKTRLRQATRRKRLARGRARFARRALR